MAFDTSQLTDYSWAQIRLAAKEAMLKAAVGGSSISINGRMISRITPREARDLYNFACEMESIESGTADSSGMALIEFKEPNQ